MAIDETSLMTERAPVTVWHAEFRCATCGRLLAVASAESAAPIAGSSQVRDPLVCSGCALRARHAMKED